MIRTRLLLSLLTMSFALTACQSDNPPLTGKPLPPPPPVKRKAVEVSGERDVVYDPKVDILFVIDDSASMFKHQENFSKSIKSFVDEIANVKSIDFHIGFTLAYDRTRYGSVVKEKCADGSFNFQPPGSLEVLLGPADQLPKDGRRFVTRDDKGFREILKQSLDPKNNKTLTKKPPKDQDPNGCINGPVNEEMFTPLIGALEDPTRAVGPNKRFRRKDAFFVVIIISDAKDASGIQPADLVKRLAAATREAELNQKRFRVFSVVMKPGTKFRNGCVPDNAFAIGSKPVGNEVWYDMPKAGDVVPENPLATLARLTQNKDAQAVDQVLDICDEDFGKTLAKYGSQVKQDALVDVKIQLGAKPQVFDDVEDPRNLNVFVNGYELNPAQWSYSYDTDVVTVYGKMVDWDKYPEAKIQVRFMPVDLKSKAAKAIED